MRITLGIAAAKEVHWATAVTQDGDVLLHRKVENSAEDIGTLITELDALDGQRLIGIDLLGGLATLISAMLIDAGERLVHVPGLAVNRARQGSVGGQAKSDPRDARIIADQTRRITRMRYLLNAIHPDLERALDLSTTGPLIMLSRYVTAAEIRAAKQGDRPLPALARCAPPREDRRARPCRRARPPQARAAGGSRGRRPRPRNGRRSHPLPNPDRRHRSQARRTDQHPP